MDSDQAHVRKYGGVTYSAEEVADELAAVLSRIVIAHGDQIRHEILADARTALDIYRAPDGASW